MRHALILAGICLLMIYQNCAEAPESNSETKSSYQAGLPWAFSEKVDTISYMSCSEIKAPVEPRAYYSFRVSAFNPNTGGLTLTDAFRNSTKYYSNTDRARVIGASEANANIRLNLSVRSRANLQQIWAQGELRVGDEISSFLPPLDSAEVAGPLATMPQGRYINYFPGPQEQRLMEASLRFYEFENVSVNTRNGLQGAGEPSYLVVGYGNAGDELDDRLRSPSSLPQRAYGTGFALTFGLPAGWSSGESRVISPNGGVQEIDLQTGQMRAGSWDCSYQFKVIRPEDVGALPGSACNRTVDFFADASQQAALNALRRVLRVEDWFVDVANRCIVPKRTGDYCYGALQGRTITYAAPNCVNGGSTMCPHFVSVCIRR